MAKQKYPEPTTGGLIFNSEGEIFLMKAYKWGNKYVIPGGHVELGEKIADAFKREIKEETGLRVHDIKLLYVLEFIFGKGIKGKKHFICFVHTCKTESTKVKLDSEGKEYVWVSPKKALKLPIEPYVKESILRYFKRK